MRTDIRPDEAKADLTSEATPLTAPHAVRAPAKDSAFVTGSHAVLFEPEAPVCDACDRPLDLPEGEDDEDEGGGRGLYLWVRHGELVFEEPPLCSACAAAITISALQRWEIEEEEG